MSPRLQNAFRHVWTCSFLKSRLYGNSLLPCSVNIRDAAHFKFGDHLIKLWHDKIACRVLGALHQQRALIRNVSCTLLSGRVRCNGCGTLLCSTDCVGLRPAVPQVRASVRHCHRPLRYASVASLPPSPRALLFVLVRTSEQKFNNFFYGWDVGHCPTSVRETCRVIGDDHIRFLFS